MEDPRIRAYYSLNPADFRDVASIDVNQEPSDQGYNLEVQMFIRSICGARVLQLAFSGVRNLKITPPDGMAIQIATLTMTSISHLQWEGVNYKVKDEENAVVSFLCWDFTCQILGA